MTESTLSSQLTDLNLAVAHFMGLGVTADDWSDDDKTIIAMIVKRGLRQFYFPPKVIEDDRDERPHEWSFMKPTTSLATVGSYSTGTIAIAITATTVTLTTGTWPSWAASHGALVVDNTEYAIASRTSDSVIELSSAWTEDTETEATYSLRHDGNYDLPDDFGGIEGNFTHTSVENKPDIQVTGEGRIRSLRRGSTMRTWPVYAAIRPKANELGTAGQRFEVMFQPIPDDAYTLYYRMNILAGMLTGTIVYPYGGTAHADTIEASCLAVAELQEDDKHGDQWLNFKSRLAASIQIDKVANSADFLGYNGDDSDIVDSDDRHGRRLRSHTVTYNGETS